MVRVAVALIALSLSGGVNEGAAAGVLDGVRARGSVQCGGFDRPGLAAPDDKNRAWQGLEVDVCRAVAAAVLGGADKITFRGYDSPAARERLVRGADDISFLTGTEIQDHRVSGRIIPGPAIFIESHALMIPATAPERHVTELAGDAGICFVSGSPLERSLPAFFEARARRWRPVPFSEDGEMLDAYNVQRCHAVAGEVTTLAARRQERGVNNLVSRILPEPLLTYPILATTSTQDGAWSAIVAWTVYTLIAADRLPGKWLTGGADAMPAPLAELGLGAGWQARVVKAVGTYRDVFERNLGAGSAMRLSPGPNGAPAGGGQLVSPVIE
jgi:general L-amino acid transport system substrate-binding protein